MPSKVSIKVIAGSLEGKTFEFQERATCLIGRGSACQLRLPSTTEIDRRCSRHHCLLDINPPDIRIRDLGSLNGTKVNDEIIGRRKKGQTREDAARIKYREHDLKSGDQITVGTLVFQTEIFIPKVCTCCQKEIPDDQSATGNPDPEDSRCEDCRVIIETTQPYQQPPNEVQQCTQCGRDVADEMGTGRHGEFICSACQAEPLQLIRRLLADARSGEHDLKSIKDYEIEKRLGKGGMGAVYLARNTISGERVALKVMLPQVAANEWTRKLFLREIKNTAALNHPHIVPVYDYGHSQGMFFFTLELCRYRSVDRVMKNQGGVLPVRRAIKITLQALDALEYAHNVDVEVELLDGSTRRAHGLVHRDLSPQNILLTGSPSELIAKVSDFGLAKAFDTAGLSGMTRSGAMAGKPYYMPRQQVVDYLNAKPEVDVWAMAACLYQMLTGKPPRNFIKGLDPWIVILETAAIPIRERDKSIPKRLAEVIDEALQDKPKIRYQSAQEFREALINVT